MPEPPQRPAIAQAPLSVVLPAYNQEAALENVVNGWRAHLDSLGRDYELLVVDDGSSDRTGELADSLAVQHPRLRVLRHPGSRGFGAALRTGLAAAQYPLLFYADCTNAYQPADLGLLLETIDQVDLVSGYRVCQNRRYQFSWKEYAYRWLVRLFFGVRLIDVDCSFKLFRRAIFARIPIQSDGDFVHAEILAKANFLGCYMTEAPVRYQPAEAAKLSHPAASERSAEAFRIFFHPDFGPAVLPVETAAPEAKKAHGESTR